MPCFDAVQKRSLKSLLKVFIRGTMSGENHYGGKEKTTVLKMIHVLKLKKSASFVGKNEKTLVTLTAIVLNI